MSEDTFNLEEYLNSLNLSNNSCPITLENNSIIENGISSMILI